jgi:signal transduction histidine kinase
MTAHISTAYQFISPFLADPSELPEIRAALHTLVEQAVKICRLEDCSVAVLDQAGTHGVLLATFQKRQPDDGDEGESLPTFALAERAALLRPLLTGHTPLVLSDCPFDVALQESADASARLICLPLLEKQQLLGMLLASSSGTAPLTEQQCTVLRLLAGQAALVLSNARLTRQAKLAERARTSFLSLITHELRGPLNSINGYLDLLLEDLAGALSEQQREFVQRARAGSEYLYTLLEDLLLTARVDAGQVRLKRERVRLVDLVEDVLEGLGLAARDAKVSLEVAIPSGLPALDADAVRLQQILRNLLSNAVRFTPAGGQIILSARTLPGSQSAQHARVEISVSDTGCGVAPEYHERIFERFFQLPNTTGGRISGQGLGLTVVKTLVELHGGQIQIESAPGAGSTFRFTLDEYGWP